MAKVIKMKMRWKGFFVLLALIVTISLVWISIIGALGYFDEDRTEVERSFAARPGMNVSVSNHNGKVDISVHEEDEIQFQFVKKTHFGREELDRAELVIDETDDNISFNLEIDRLVHWVVTDMKLKLPRDVLLNEVEINSGTIIVDGVSGNLSVSSGSAEVMIENVGEVGNIKTDSGGINIRDCGTVHSVKANAGGIEIRNCERVRYASVGGGGIIVRDTLFLQEAHADAGGLDMEVDRVPVGGMLISTDFGGATLKIPVDVNATVDMKADSGEVSVDFPGSKIDLDRDREDEKTGTLNSGGPLIKMRAETGGLELIGV